MYDSHAHIISGDQAGFPPLNADDPAVAAKLGAPFTAEKLLAAMDAEGVDKALVVQRSQFYGFDNSYVIAASRQSRGRLKAVCSIDATDPGCGDHVTAVHAQGAAGVRLMAPISAKDFDWLDGPNAGHFWSASADAGLPVCVHFFQWNRAEGLQRLQRQLDRYAIADVVIDHLTNAPVETVQSCGIDDSLRQMGDRGNISLKFTAIPLNGLAERGIDAGAVLQAYIGVFGADRLLWGSDITQSRGSYGEMVASGRAAVASFPGEVQQQLLHGNTERIYKG